MQFISWQFIILFAVAMIFLLSEVKAKKYILAVCCFIFYISSGISGFVVLALFTTVTYIFGVITEKHKSKLTFFVMLVLALCPLLFYKYAGFVVHEIFRMREITGVTVPIGISFFTFSGVGYLVDVYKGKCGAEKNFINYFIFLSLFTCITSGPINRSQSLLAQIKEYDRTKFCYDRCAEGFRYVLIGILLKVLVSARLAQAITNPFNVPAQVSGLALLIASLFFTIQIFCDFCGYSYMAYGLSKIIGIDVVQNFKAPYFSLSVTEFWRRWHISLSSWFRDYVYFPLGGSRCSKARTCVNLVITFTVSGLWHGAAWTYITWGFMNGVIIVIEKLIGFNKEVSGRTRTIVHWMVTLLLTNTMWIFFRAATLPDAILIIRKILTDTIHGLIRLRSMASILELVSELGITASGFVATLVGIMIFVVFEIFADRKDKPTYLLNSRKAVVRWTVYIALIFVILIFGVTGKAGEFIYAKF